MFGLPASIEPADLIGFVNATASSATLSIAWDKTVATVDLTLAATK